MIPIDPVRYPKFVLSLGGNALIRPRDPGTLEEQYRRISQAMAHPADLIISGFAPVITHGNGPMVGYLVLQMECARALVPPMPLFISDADTEGSLGYLIQQGLVNELHRRGQKKGVATVITQVVVSADDPAFSSPDKPIGPFYSAGEAERLQTERGWCLTEDAGRGCRRVGVQPFGGFKMSGSNAKAGGPDYVWLFMEVKTVGGEDIAFIKRERKLTWLTCPQKLIHQLF